MEFEKTEMNNKRLWVFIAIAYGLTFLMSLVMYEAHRKGLNTTLFVNVQMMYPACGVILGKLLLKDEQSLPVAGYITTLATTAVMIVIAVLSVVFPIAPIKYAEGLPEIDIWNVISQFPLIAGSVTAYILFWVCGKEKRVNAGIERKNIKQSIILVAVFVALLIGRAMIGVFITDLMTGTDDEWQTVLASLTNPMTWISLAVLPINFIFVFLAFFGEEYGWRYYLQPLMQNRFGKRAGVLLLGLVWAVWHIGVDFMYYTDGYGLQAFAGQIVTCVVMAIFFGYAYMKTENIWMVVIMHYLNNNIAALLAGGGEDALQNQVINWKDIPVLAASSVVFALFIFMPLYNRKTEEVCSV